MEETVLDVVRMKTQSSLKMVGMNMVPSEHKHPVLDDGHTSKVVTADYTEVGKRVVEILEDGPLA